MKKIDQRFPKKLIITSYWPRRTAEENNIGYGVTRKHIFYYLVISPFERSLGWFVDPRVRPAVSPIVRMMMLFLPLIATSIALGGRKYNGFYTLDDQGRPLTFLGHLPAAETSGRVGMGRKKFIRQLRNLPVD
ncbi:hypothetical protein KDA_70260 [Dictyobacter alpinus]|uniref:Uncharacterized protein n=1 Tax=Dictyobacter alpinus TaxID=2014873 RepID=A0A402BJL6_9CHLR|nr:hypothetical protein [Dictyobacter alpinus]GCE31542.1 hypothetical protein KDA_70260 [Dictyobacter alpinus]